MMEMVLEDLMGPEEDERFYRQTRGIGADTPPSDVYRVYLYNRTTGKWEESTDPKAFYDAKFNAFKGGTYSYAELYLNNTLTETVGQKPAVPGPTPPAAPPGGTTLVDVRGDYTVYEVETSQGKQYATFIRIDPTPPRFVEMGFSEFPVTAPSITQVISTADTMINTTQGNPQQAAANLYGSQAPKRITITKGVSPSPNTKATIEKDKKNRVGVKVYPVAPPATAKSGCFIATAAYGTPQAPQIDVLRQFRDERLMTDPFGRACVKGYYTLSPPIAEVVSMSETLRKAVRALIAPLVQGR